MNPVQHYYTETNDRGRRIGLIAAGAYVVVLAILLLTVRFSIRNETVNEGIIVDFGVADGGAGQRELPVSQQQPPEPLPITPDPTAVTQDVEDAPSVRTETEREPEAVVVEEPKINPRALFPGMSSNTQTQSQGDSGETANRGHEAGAESTPDAAGQGSEGAQVNLPDRQIIGRLPLPAYKEDVQGQIIVDIVVDSRGNVTGAFVRSRGTTILNTVLQNEAIAAARRSRFSNADNATEQSGSITYIFKLK